MFKKESQIKNSVPGMKFPINEMLDFSGKTVLVTGGSKGIGAAVVRRFAEAGADVCIHYGSNEKAAKELAGFLKSATGKIDICPGDMGKLSDISSLFAAVRERFGRLDVLVNNAGIYPVQTLRHMTPEEWEGMLRINLTAPAYCTKEAAAIMRNNEGTGVQRGVIINIGSVEGENPAFGHSHYTAAKGGLTMFTRAAAKELGPDGIRVNTISPGLIFKEGLAQAWPQGVEEYLNTAPLGRLGTGADIADACLFLASSGASWITGVNLRVDGGLLASRGY
jgi:NAD(P)-dependent dehydrogenase (short-subunit alcohol dehydrogenase family)